MGGPVPGTHRSNVRDSLSHSAELSPSLNPYSPNWAGASGDEDRESRSPVFLEVQNDTCSNPRRQRGNTRKEREINVPVTSLPSPSRDCPFPRLFICLYHLKDFHSSEATDKLNRVRVRWLMPSAQDFRPARSRAISSATSAHALPHTCPFTNSSDSLLHDQAPRGTFGRKVLLCPGVVSKAHSFVRVPEHLTVPCAFVCLFVYGGKNRIRKQGQNPSATLGGVGYESCHGFCTFHPRDQHSRPAICLGK